MEQRQAYIEKEIERHNTLFSQRLTEIMNVIDDEEDDPRILADLFGIPVSLACRLARKKPSDEKTSSENPKPQPIPEPVQVETGEPPTFKRLEKEAELLKNKIDYINEELDLYFRICKTKLEEIDLFYKSVHSFTDEELDSTAEYLIKTFGMKELEAEGQKIAFALHYGSNIGDATRQCLNTVRGNRMTYILLKTLRKNAVLKEFRDRLQKAVDLLALSTK